MFLQSGICSWLQVPVPEVSQGIFCLFWDQPQPGTSERMENSSGVTSIIEELGYRFRACRLVIFLFLKEHDSEKGLYILYKRKGHQHLIVELSTLDKAWKNDFFFISDNCLENKEGKPKFRASGKKWVRIKVFSFELLIY